MTPVNDVPIGMNGTVTTPEDTTYVLKTVDFGFTDPNTSDLRPADPNSLASVQFTTLPSAA